MYVTKKQIFLKKINILNILEIKNFYKPSFNLDKR